MEVPRPTQGAKTEVDKCDKNDNLMLLHDLCIKTLTSSLDNTPQVICISETCIKHQPLTNIDLSQYNFVHIDYDTNAGGAAIYVRSTIKAKFYLTQYKLTTAELH